MSVDVTALPAPCSNPGWPGTHRVARSDFNCPASSRTAGMIAWATTPGYPLLFLIAAWWTKYQHPQVFKTESFRCRKISYLFILRASISWRDHVWVISFWICIIGFFFFCSNLRICRLVMDRKINIGMTKRDFFHFEFFSCCILWGRSQGRISLMAV